MIWVLLAAGLVLAGGGLIMALTSTLDGPSGDYKEAMRVVVGLVVAGLGGVLLLSCWVMFLLRLISKG